MRDVTIKPALNGYVVRLGCQRVVFTDRVQMLQVLDDYLENPYDVERMYLGKSCNSRQLGFATDSSMNAPTEQCYPEPVASSSYED